MLNVEIVTIPHSEQRYPTCGDWFHNFATGRDVIQVSDLESWKMETLIAFHEFAEAALCRAHGIKEQQVDDFDKSFEGEGEPGDDPEAPYHLEHIIASALERTLAAWLDVDWAEYELRVNSLGGFMAPKIPSEPAKPIPGCATSPKVTGKNDTIPGTNTSSKDNPGTSIPGTIGLGKGK